MLASRTHISPGGVGLDIGCGNKAVLTNLAMSDVRGDIPRLMVAIFGQLSFGVGRKNDETGSTRSTDAKNHGGFISALAELTNTWVKEVC